MKKIVIVILSVQLHIGAMCQKIAGADINVNLGERKTGLGFSYGIASHTDVLFNLNLSRYFSIGAEVQLKAYLFPHIAGEKIRFGTPFLSIGYEYIPGAKFNKEDSRRFVNSYYVPDNQYISGEIGYRFYGKSKKDAAGLTIRNADVSISLLYYWGLQKNYSAYVRSGSDVEGQVNKINRFMDGGLGGAATFHIPLKLLIGR
jgi:hypothetical protein